MKKFFVLSLVALSVLAAGCRKKADFPEDGDVAFEGPDEEVRIEIYRFFNDIFFYDKETGAKTELRESFDTLADGGDFEEFEAQYADVLGGNVIGVKKLRNNLFQTDVVFFEEEFPYQNTYEVESIWEGDVLSFDLELVNRQDLEFEESALVDSVESESGRYRVELIKNLFQVTFYTVDERNIASFLGRYDLVLVDQELDADTVIDYSFDPFSTSLPFIVEGFSENERFIEYFEQGLGKIFNLYDVAAGSNAFVEIPGIIDDSFWYEDKFVVCTLGDDFVGSLALVMKKGGWKIEDQKFIYPVEINELETADERWDFLSTNNLFSEGLGCELKGDFLRFDDPVSGEKRQVDLREF